MVTPESDAAGATDWRTAQFDRPKATGGDWPHEFQNCFNVSLCNWVVVTGPRGLFFHSDSSTEPSIYETFVSFEYHSEFLQLPANPAAVTEIASTAPLSGRPEAASSAYWTRIGMLAS